MNVITAPDKSFFNRSLFLAGSIENGAAEEWQVRFINEYQRTTRTGLAARTTILNPRRDEWDPNAKSQDICDQVAWELQAMEKADVIAMYFDPMTKSPITLLELGLWARSGKLIVCCPDTFYRFENVLVTCNKYGVKLVRSWQGFVGVVSAALWPMYGL